MRASSWLVLAALPALAATTLATFAALHFSADLLAHFPLPCLLALLPATVALAVCRRRGWAVLFALGAMLAGSRLWPQLIATPPQATGSAATALRVGCVNLRFNNDRVTELLRQIESEQPDLLMISELWPAAWTQLQPLRRAYPHVVAQPRQGCFGIALLSKLPLRDARVVPLGHDWTPAIVATALHPSGPIGLLAAHPPPPGLARRSRERNRSLNAIPMVLDGLPERRIVLGDLNASPWSAPFCAMLATAELIDSNRGAGYQGSWPARLPAPLRIPIDHVLVSAGIGVQARRLGVEFGSDHLPLFADLLLPAAKSR